MVISTTAHSHTLSFKQRFPNLSGLMLPLFQKKSKIVRWRDKVSQSSISDLEHHRAWQKTTSSTTTNNNNKKYKIPQCSPGNLPLLSKVPPNAPKATTTPLDYSNVT